MTGTCGCSPAPQRRPTQLYAGRKGTEGFEFDRTVSRLIEMQGKDWLKELVRATGKQEIFDVYVNAE